MEVAHMHCCLNWECYRNFLTRDHLRVCIDRHKAAVVCLFILVLYHTVPPVNLLTILLPVPLRSEVYRSILGVCQRCDLRSWTA